MTCPLIALHLIYRSILFIMLKNWQGQNGNKLAEWQYFSIALLRQFIMMKLG
jgi:hypothetical protein